MTSPAAARMNGLMLGESLSSFQHRLTDTYLPLLRFPTAFLTLHSGQNGFSQPIGDVLEACETLWSRERFTMAMSALLIVVNGWLERVVGVLVHVSIETQAISIEIMNCCSRKTESTTHIEKHRGIHTIHKFSQHP